MLEILKEKNRWNMQAYEICILDWFKKQVESAWNSAIKVFKPNAY